MDTKGIITRIISDAEEKANSIISVAEEKAKKEAEAKAAAEEKARLEREANPTVEDLLKKILTAIEKN